MDKPLFQRRNALLVSIVLSILMYAFLKAPLWTWQHKFLGKTTINVNSISSDIEINAKPFDAIVVLGYAVNHDEGIVTLPLSSRLELAFQLLNNHTLSDRVLMTGGCSWSKADELPSEAQVMKEWMIARWNGSSLPEEPNSSSTTDASSKPLPTIITENQSTSTYTNALFSLRLLQSQHPNVKRLLLVTNRFHQLRTYLTWHKVTQSEEFVHHGFTIDMPGYDDDSSWSDIHCTQLDFFRELAALGFYLVKGYI